MKKCYEKPTMEWVSCEMMQPLAASLTFSEGETDIMYSPEVILLMSGWGE